MAASNVKKIIILVVLLVLVAGGAVIWTKVSKESDSSSTENVSSDNSSDSEQPLSGDKTYDVADILEDFRSYEGQELTIKGELVRIEKGYLLASTTDSERKAILVDFSKTDIDPSEYAIQGSSSKEQPEGDSGIEPQDIKPPVTLKGKLIIDSTQIPVIEAISITN